MRNLNRLLLITLIMVSGINVRAQKNRVVKLKAKTTKTTATKTVENAGQQIFHTMLPATAKVMFIDSLVVGKADFLSKIPLPHEIGTLSVRGKNSIGDNLVQYENDFGDRRFYADGDTLGTSLFSQTLLGGGWSKPMIQSDLSESNYSFLNYPFLCSDGVTLFFSAQGHNSMGGRDIFMTIYDSDKAEWYEPQNYGLPFNSTANDYLLAVDDLDSIGWLVSDRFQPKDSVCIYTFVPTNPRQDFTNDNLSDAQLQHYAKITRIADTWKFGNRAQALSRLQAMLQRNSKDQNGQDMRFVVNDQRIVTTPSAFKSDESRKLFQQLRELQQLLATTDATLASKRLSYHDANTSPKAQLTKEILDLEKQYQQQQTDIKSLEKKIRTIEVR
ncbi:MAG: hypothetical protein I3J02_01160 [Prevotella sp.]|nr:hypothetical protein [Prevotella sp.]